MLTNLQFFLNSYADLTQTTAPALNNFRWTREINGIPYTFENNQQIQVAALTTSSNVIPYQFSNLVASATSTINATTTMTLTSSPTGIAVDQLIVGGGIAPGTIVETLGATQYTFTVTSANATAGATYSNNGQTFTVSSTIVAGTTLTCTGTGSPLASGTLTLVSGTGDATITFSAFTQSTPLTMSLPATGSGSPSVSFYNPATFLYMESDQQVSVIYNNGTAMALNPFEINGSIVPGVFFMNGPVYSLTVTNPNAVAANVFLALLG